MTDHDAAAYDSADVDCYALISAAGDTDRLAEAVIDSLHSLAERHPHTIPQAHYAHLAGALIWIGGVFLHGAARTNSHNPAPEDTIALAVGLVRLAQQKHPDATPLRDEALRRAAALIHWGLTEASEEKPLSERFGLHMDTMEARYGPDAILALLFALATVTRDLADLDARRRGETLDDMLAKHELITIQSQCNEDEWGW